MRSFEMVPGRCWPPHAAEVVAYVAQSADQLDEDGHRLTTDITSPARC
jgi:hypothetical protein